jgi:hypothetical protein
VDTYGNGLGNAFTASGSQTDSTNNVQPVVILASDGNTNYQGSKGASINSLYRRAPTTADAHNGQSVGFTQYTSPVPLLKSWNLTLQRSITGNVIADLGYVGNHGTHLPWLTDLNQVPEDRLGPNDAAFRPYPRFQSITGVTTSSISNYHALQAGITRRMSNGLMFNFNYTWSHMLSTQDSSGWGSKQGNQPYQRAYNPGLNYGPSNFDVRHLFKGQAIYNLPFGHGRRFLNKGGALDEEYIEGVRCVAAPIRAEDGQVIGAIGISAPLTRFPTKRYETCGKQVTKIAQQISDLLTNQAQDD